MCTFCCCCSLLNLAGRKTKKLFYSIVQCNKCFHLGVMESALLRRCFFRITCILEFYNLVGSKFSYYTAPTYFLCLKKTLFFYKQCNGFPDVEELMSEI